VAREDVVVPKEVKHWFLGIAGIEFSFAADTFLLRDRIYRRLAFLWIPSNTLTQTDRRRL